MTMRTSGTSKRRSRAWIYYSILALLSFAAVFLGQVGGLIGTVLFGCYAVYLYRGGRFVLWFW